MPVQIVKEFEGAREFTPQGSAFGEYLRSTGKLQDSALERAERLSSESGDRFETVITRLGLVSERDLAEALAGFLKLPMAAAHDYPDAPILEEQLSRKYLKTAQIIPNLMDILRAYAQRREKYAVATGSVCSRTVFTQ